MDTENVYPNSFFGHYWRSGVALVIRYLYDWKAVKDKYCLQTADTQNFDGTRFEMGINHKN